MHVLLQGDGGNRAALAVMLTTMAITFVLLLAFELHRLFRMCRWIAFELKAWWRSRSETANDKNLP